DLDADDAAPPGSLTNPLPLGVVQTIGGGWQMAVRQADPDSSAQLARVDGNVAPLAGHTYLIVNVDLLYDAPGGWGDPALLLVSLVDARGMTYEQFSSGCGRIPAPIYAAGPVPGRGSVNGNL